MRPLRKGQVTRKLLLTGQILTGAQSRVAVPPQREKRSDRLDAASGIAKALHALNAQPVRQAEEQIAHRHPAKLEVATRRHSAAAGAGQHDWQVDVRVAVAVRIAAPG